MQKITQYLNTELSELPTNTKKRTIFLRVSPKLITHYSKLPDRCKRKKLLFLLDTVMSLCGSNSEWMMQKPLQRKYLIFHLC